MASLNRWTQVWVNSGSWWWTGRPGVLRFMGSQRVRHNWATEMNWTELKQETARANIDILGISELKRTWMGELNSDDHYIYYCGQESLRRNGVPIIVNKRVQNAVLWCNLKNDRMISVHFQGKSFNITVIQVYLPTAHAKEAEVEWFYEDLQDLLELTSPHQKKMSFSL